MIIRKLTITLIICLVWHQFLQSQSVISVGSGSYASYPPDYEYVGGDASYGTFYDFATNSDNIDVTSSKINDPIPTNDWWTSILTEEDSYGNRLGGNLWTYPLLCRTTTSGLEIGNMGIDNWSTDELGSRSLGVDYLIALVGSSFTPTKTIAMNWSDWHVDLRTQVGDDDSKRIDITIAQGMPYVWAKTHGFDPIVQAYHPGVRTYYSASGSVLTFPTTTDRFAIEYDGNFYGVHFSQSVTITSVTNGLSIAGYADKWVVFSALNSVSDLNTLHQYAFVRPTNTSLDYVYSPDAGSVTATYNITTEVITGTETKALQGFIPHHYRGNANSFSFSSLSYTGTPRGTIKMATGTSFKFNYEFNADILPHFKEPEIVSSESIQYDPDKLNEMIDDYAANIELYGVSGGTYWGGKNLVRLLKYILMAKEAGNSNYTSMLATAKEKVYDWLTFTPNETENYYCYYSAWKALVGFDEEYYSAYFTDNHFHYGYLAHACALLEMADPGSMDGYWDMITMIIKTYANWDRTDTEFPYFRTFSPWMGHSFASGLGNSIGNNQESSSEAMQSWAGMFMVAEMSGNTSMRNAAAFGYLTESRAIADYWYDESGSFEEVGYEKPITGILEMNRFVYGTFFGAQETYIHGIQWLPISPAYGFWNDFLTTSEANALVDPIISNMATDLGGSISADWMNVCLGFKLFFDPEAVVSKFNGYWNNTDATSAEYSVAHTPGENALTYYYAHASQNLGLRQSNYRLSLPLSSAFVKNGEVNYVVYNPSSSAQTCSVYKDGSFVTSFSVPANTLYSSDHSGTTSTLPSPWSTSDIGAVGATGSASYSSGTFTVVGAGADIWNTADEFRYVYQSLSGDGEIVAKVNSITNTNVWAKAGVMFRESLSAGSKNTAIVVTPSKGVSFQSRATTSGTYTYTAISGQTVPEWLKIKRVGNVFTAYYSADGTTWTQVGTSKTISMATSIYVGLCLTSHVDATLCTASINNVTVTNSSSVAVTGVSVSPTSTTLSVGSTQQLTPTISPSNATTQTVSYSSSNSSVATVSSSGLITAVASGSATITVTATDGSYTATCAVTVSSSSTTFVPDPTKIYYIDCPVHDLRIAATGESEDAYTTSTSTTGDDVEWKFTDKGNGYWHIDRAAGGSKPRLRTDKTQYADMQATTSTGSYTYYDFAIGASSGTYFLTLPDGPTSYKRLQVDNSGVVKMVSTASAGTWESFTITEVTATTSDCSVIGATGDYSAVISNDASNPTITFVPVTTNAGATTCILYYGTSATGVLGGHSVTPNVAHQITAANGELIYFYYTYSLATGGENNTSANRNSFTVGTCSSLKSAGDASLTGHKQNSIVYPNPVSDELNLRFEENIYTSIQLRDITGKLVYATDLTGTQHAINMSGFDSGVYVLVLSGNTSYETVQIIKK
jgi:endoglucanase Acf2/uncharacterized protein YjdB